MVFEIYVRGNPDLHIYTIDAELDHATRSEEPYISLWNYTYNSSLDYDDAVDVAVDSNDDIIAAGHEYFAVGGDIDLQWRIMKFAYLPVHNIDTGLNYTTIQGAINANETEDGHTILVDAGTYYEHVIVNKSLSLIGENRTATIIDGNNTGTIVTVRANNTNITCFTVRNSGPHYYGLIEDFDYGIYVDHANSCNLSYLTVMNNSFGLKLAYCHDITVCDNNITNNLARGIWLEYSYNCTLCKNRVTNNNSFGLVLDDSSGNILRENDMSDNKYNFGVAIGRENLSAMINDIDSSNRVNGKRVYYFINEHDLTISPKTFPDVGYVGVINSTNVIIKDLNLTHNRHGMLLGYTNSCIVENVTISHNMWGICTIRVANITVFETLVSNCSTGIQFYDVDDGNATCNTITSCGDGFYVHSSRNCMLSRNRVSNSTAFGIEATDSVDITVCVNSVLSGNWGICVDYCNNLTIRGNNLSNNRDDGLVIRGASNFTVSSNNILNNDRCGIWLGGCRDGMIYHNNFVNNTDHVVFSVYSESYFIFLDNGAEGNYWSDYLGIDLNHDGIGDTPHVIDANNQDNYPLMGMFSDFKATPEYHVQTICNSTISDFQFNGTAISFNVTGKNGTTGFCRMCIPKALMNDTYKVFVNGTEVQHTLLPCSNSTHSYLYFTYGHSTLEVVVTPEFPSALILPVLMIFTLVAVMLSSKKRRYVNKQLQ